MSEPLAHRLPIAALVAWAIVLLAMTLAWHVPLMAWDHLDLVPMLQAWRSGTLDATFWDVHGGHLHTAAYALLLLTTVASGGQPWLDCVLSWLLLLGFAAVIAHFARDAARRSDGDAVRRGWWLPVALALYPGHLANLQWGWQVAVFLCLLGVALALLALTRARLDARHSLAALLATALALASFATAIALIPTAILLIALRSEIPPMRRLLLASPWLALGIAMLAWYHALTLHEVSDGADPALIVRYALNFIGAGIGRFATTVAPWLAVVAIAFAAWRWVPMRTDRRLLPWVGLMLFAGGSALAVALGRAAPFGAEHAFATRYVSFSALFWIGWVGVVLGSTTTKRSGRAIALGFFLLFASANAVHMVGKAADVGRDSREIAQHIRADWPRVDDALLGALYFGQPGIARERLQVLHALGYAPFQRVPPARAE